MSRANPDSHFNPVDMYWMRQAIALSADAMYSASPNPRVACLIVRGGQLLASGVTQAPGGAHAEVMALRQAQARGVSLQGATFYVTLEPCSHYGRTPPCADAIVRAAPARVVVAMADPNPLVAGQGIAKLHGAGIATTVGVCAAEALEINPGFVARMTRATPWVWLKTAVSLDGRTALNNGQSQWITGAAARRDGHHWRARSCAVLTGIGTVLADDPQLTVRAIDTPRQPLRVALDSRLRMPLDAHWLDGGNTLILTGADDAGKIRALQDRGARIERLPTTAAGQVDLSAALRTLAEQAINEVHVEAGAALNGALLQAGLVDELLVYMAPMLVGAGLPLATLPELSALTQAQTYTFLAPQSLGADLRLRLRRQDRWQGLLNSVANIATNN